MSTSKSLSTHSVSFRLRVSQEQRSLLQRAAEVAHMSLKDFVLDRACVEAEQTLREQGLFMVSEAQHHALINLLAEPEQPNPGLIDLFSHTSPWVRQP